ncbi:c-type cytochrome [Chrysiogenes arsenatis]|uniref:c-type cytochrome n=1 Tax=Chrysiogenes arsenatis TaxID=309797 RepID=UPI00040112CA|nr:cytochrome c [Chrysiogenes arsenatis]
MKLKALLTGAIVASAVFFAVSAIAAPPEDGKGPRGRFVFKKECRTCHDGAKASDMNPNTFTMEQWIERLDNMMALPCAAEWKEKVKEQDLKNIYRYLHDGALDSPQPATCG